MVDFWPTVIELLVTAYQSTLYTWFLFQLLSYRPIAFPKPMAELLCWVIFFVANSVFHFNYLWGRFGIWLYSLLFLFYALLFLKGGIWKKILISLLPGNCAAIGNLLADNFNAFLLQMSLEYPPSNEIAFLWDRYNLWDTLYLFMEALFTSLFLLLVWRIVVKSGLRLSRSESVLTGTVLSISTLIMIALYLLAFSESSFSGRTYLSDLLDRGYLSLVILGIAAINIVIYILLGKLSRQHQLETENALLKYQYRVQEQSTENLKAHYQELQKIRHDIKNSMNVLQILNKQGKQEAVDQYIQEYLKSQGAVFQYVNTDNLVFNAILNEKLSKAYQLGIQVTIQVPPKVTGMDEVDLCNLIGNLFDNAIEGCRLSAKKEIVFILDSTPQEWNLFIKNTIRDSVLTKNPTLASNKPEAENHGFGTKIIRDIAAKYAGLMDYYEEDGYFCCNLILSPKQVSK